MSKCLKPVTAWICGSIVAKDGAVSPHLVFSPNEAIRYYSAIGCLHLMDTNTIDLPCGHCINCQMQKRKDMSVRLAHEASCFDDCCFITLTYNQEFVPCTDRRDYKDKDKMFDRGFGELPELTLYPRDVQLFMKRLRAHLDYYCHKKIRYFAVGEYGGKTHRPHYHILIFGWKPTDLELFKMSKGKPVYRSALLEDKWIIGRGRNRKSLGFVTVSDVSPFVAKYCARYVTKKYARLDGSDDRYVIPEFTLQSVKDGGIGATWFDKYGVHACNVGLCTLRCSPTRISKHSIPRYYWHRLRQKHLPVWLHLRDERIRWINTHSRPTDFAEVCNIAACAVEQLKHEKETEIL